ncbi:MAG: DNA repair protein RecO [Lachnospiraceae bacterium]|nr:DNA repair protein RecO [Lachnospiraceae bacterium]
MSDMESGVLTGVVISTAEAGEYDRRVTLITGERGLVTAFARGARRQNSRFLSSTSPFTFGRFKVNQGRNSSSIAEVDVIDHFDPLKHDLSSVAYASYLLELSGYFSQEDMEADETIRLIYMSFRALESPGLDDRLVRRVFEIRTLINEGIYPGPGNDRHSGSFYKALSHIESAPVESLYTFRVSDEVMEELSGFGDSLIRRYVDRPLKTAESISLLLANGAP